MRVTGRLVRMRTRQAWVASVVLLGGCALFGARKRGASDAAKCETPIQVLNNSEPTRSARTLRRVSATCGREDECDSTLVARACELGADAVIVESRRVLERPRNMREIQYQSAPVPDPSRTRAGDTPQQEPVLGSPPQWHVAEARLVVWVD